MVLILLQVHKPVNDIHEEETVSQIFFYFGITLISMLTNGKI